MSTKKMKNMKKAKGFTKFKVRGLCTRLSTLVLFIGLCIAFLLIDQLTSLFSFYTHKLSIGNSRSLVKSQIITPQITYFGFQEKLSPIQTNLSYQDHPVFIHLENSYNNLLIQQSNTTEVTLLTKTINRGLLFPYPGFSASFYDQTPTPPLFYVNSKIISLRPLITSQTLKNTYNQTLIIGGKFDYTTLLLTNSSNITISNVNSTGNISFNSLKNTEIEVENSTVNIDFFSSKSAFLTLKNSNLTVFCTLADDIICSDFDGKFTPETCRKTFYAGVSVKQQVSVTVPVGTFKIVYRKDEKSVVRNQCGRLEVSEEI